MQDAGSEREPPLTNLPMNPPIEKHRPPDGQSSAPDAAVHLPSMSIKAHPPSWSPTDLTQINGYRSADFRVQMPPTPNFSPNGPTTPSLSGTPNSVAGSVPQSPFIQTPSAYPSLFSSATTMIVQPSPIKKKLSLGDYMSRRSNSRVEAPSSTAEKQDSSSPTMQHTALKPSSALAEEAKAHDMEGSAIVETPVKEDVDPLAETEDPKA